MNIREHFQQTMKWQVTYPVVALGIVLVVLDIWILKPQRGREDIAHDLAIGLLLALLVLLLVRGRFVCPRCGTDFMKLRRKQQPPPNRERRMFWDAWDKCPHCDLSFDEPWPE